MVEARLQGPDFATIKAALLDRVEQLVRDLAPNGKRNGGYWMARNPVRDDRHAGSFWIRVANPAIGAWRDEATGDKGDVIDLIKYLKQLPDRKQTRAWALHWLGWSKGDGWKKFEVKKKADGYYNEQQAKLDAQAAAKKARSAFGWWLKCNKDLAGTPVDIYLRGRGVDLSKFKYKPGAIRFDPNAEHYDEDGVITQWPAMVVAMCNPRGEVAAIHRTFLMPDGSGKAPVDPVKKIWPSYKGCMIRLSKGRGNLTPEGMARERRKMPLVVTEGIEDGLTLALACPDMRIWAAGTLGNMANVPLLPCVSEIILVADNDEHKQAKQNFKRVIAALQKRGAVVKVTRSWVGKDANDMLKGIDDET